MARQDSGECPSPGEQFQSTHWSLVLTAGQSDSPAAQQALAKLCSLYWYPVYAFIRRQGSNPDQAQDLTQQFFSSVIEKRSLRAADRERGRFRSFLLACVQHFLSHQLARDRALKRGGRYQFVSLDEAEAERRYSEAADGVTPETLYEQQWALALLQQVLDELRREYVNGGKAAQFEALHPFLSGPKDGELSYEETGAALSSNATATRQAVHRMRRRFRELLWLAVSQTVASPREVEAELAHLKAIFMS